MPGGLQISPQLQEMSLRSMPQARHEDQLGLVQRRAEAAARAEKFTTASKRREA